MQETMKERQKVERKNEINKNATMKEKQLEGNNDGKMVRMKGRTK